MTRQPNHHGGGAQTNVNGLLFEQTTSLNDVLLDAGFQISNTYEVYYNNQFVGHSINKAHLSTKFYVNVV